MGLRLPRFRLGLDRWDTMGAAGLAFFCGGVGQRFGWEWASILFGLALVTLYVLHERTAAAVRR